MAQALTEHAVAVNASDREKDVTHALERIRDALRGLRFGTVTIIIQDGVVVQVERTEKLRLARRGT